MIELSQKSQRRLADINKVIVLLFPRFKTLSQYCIALGYSAQQLKSMDKSQIDNFLTSLLNYLKNERVAEKASILAGAISKSGSELDKAAQWGSYGVYSKGFVDVGPGEVVRTLSESQDKLSSAIKQSLEVKVELEKYVLEHLTPMIGGPIGK